MNGLTATFLAYSAKLARDQVMDHPHRYWCIVKALRPLSLALARMGSFARTASPTLQSCAAGVPLIYREYLNLNYGFFSYTKIKPAIVSRAWRPTTVACPRAGNWGDSGQVDRT